MRKIVHPPPKPATDQSLRAELSAIAEPAWIIDPLAARIVMANAAACAVWGAECLEGMPLDRAMPGVRELAALALRPLPLEAEQQAALLFWTAAGAVHLIGHCRRLNRATGTPLILVRTPVSADGASQAKAVHGTHCGPPMPRSAYVFHASHLAKLAHELRTPLSAIVALAEIMKEERLGPMENARYLGYVGDIYDCARHVLSVASAMLEHESVKDGLLPVEPIEIDVNAMAASCVSAVRPLAEQAGVRLETRLQPGLPSLLADRRNLMQILFNLLANALKFTPRNGTITVTTSHDSGRSLEIVVADSGAGMSEAEIARAMASTIAAAPQAGERSGVGYGLPLAKALAEANGAVLAIDSALGSGTRVSLAFSPDHIITA
jgi:two-component system cell cycle sensor histidine kinase PleC